MRRTEKSEINSDSGSKSFIIRFSKPIAYAMIIVCVLIVVYMLLFTPKTHPEAYLYPRTSTTPGIYEIQHRLERQIKNQEVLQAYFLLKQNRLSEAAVQAKSLLNTIHDEQRKFIYYILGEIEFSKKQYSDSIPFYDNALLIDKNFFECLIKKADAESRLGNQDNALSLLKRAQTLKPNSFVAHFEIGKIYYRQKKYERAIIEFNSALAVANDIRALFYKADCQYYSGDKNSAVKTFDTISQTETEPNIRVAALRKLYSHYFELQDYTRGITYLQQWKNLVPTQEELYFELGKSFYLIKKYKEAYQYLQEAFERKPDNIEILVFLAMAEIALKNYNSALQTIRRFQKNQPDDYRIFRLSGDAYFGLNEYQKSLENYQKYFQKVPADKLDKEIYFRIARIYDAQGKYQEAIEYLNKCLEIRNINKKDVYYNLAVVYDHKGDYENALHYLMQTLKITDKKEPIRSYIGDIYLKMRRFSEAIDFYERVLKTHPESQVAALKLGNAYFQQGNFNQARVYFAKITRYKHVSGQSKKYVALAYMRLGDIEQIEQNYFKAAGFYESAVQYDFKNARAKVNLSRMYIFMLHYKKAEEMLDKLLSTENKNEIRSTIYYLLGQLKLKQGFRKRGIEYVKKAVQLNPMNEEARLFLSNFE